MIERFIGRLMARPIRRVIWMINCISIERSARRSNIIWLSSFGVRRRVALFLKVAIDGRSDSGTWYLLVS